MINKLSLNLKDLKAHEGLIRWHLKFKIHSKMKFNLIPKQIINNQKINLALAMSFGDKMERKIHLQNKYLMV